VSNIVQFNPTQLPAFARTGALSETAKALAGGGVGQTGKRVSIKGGVFRLLSAGKEVAAIDERYLDVVIVNAAPKVSRTFYMAQYDSEKVTAPDCWSADGVTPATDASNKQSDKCDGCPQNIQGSGNGNSRACRFQQRLAVVLANDMEGDVMQLALPAQSIFGKEEGKNRPLQAYARYMTAMGAGPDAVVTRLRFDTKAPVPKLFFEAKRWLSDDEYAVAVEKGQTREATNAITMTVSQTDTKVVSQTEVAGTAPKAVKKAKPKVEEDDGDEPEVRKEAVVGKNVPKGGSDLNKLVDAWDDTDD